MAATGLTVTKGHFFDMDAVATVGVQARIDAIHARLGPQVKRAPLGTTVDSNIDEALVCTLPQIGTAADSMAATGGGVHTELFTFDVRNRCATCTDQPAGNTSSGLVLPKMNVILGALVQDGILPTTARATILTTSSAVVQVASPFGAGEELKSDPVRSPGVQMESNDRDLVGVGLNAGTVFCGRRGTAHMRGADARDGSFRAWAALGAAVFQRQRDVDQGGN